MSKNQLRTHLPLMFAAWLIASIIWIMAKMSTLQTEQLMVPVSLGSVPANVRVDYSPKKVPIIVRFPPSQRPRVIDQNFEVRIDLQAALGGDPRTWADPKKPTVQSYPLTFDNIHRLNLPESVRVTGLGGPSMVTIEASLVAQQFPVKVETTGSLPPNFELRRELVAEPATVLATGNPDVLRSIAETGAQIPTEPINLQDRNADFIAFPNLRAPEGIQVVNDEERRVQVFVGIREKEVTRTFEGVPIEFFVLAEGLKAVVTPAVAQIRVRGQISVLDSVRPSMFAFAPKEFIPEETGAAKSVELVVTFDEDAPPELRKDAEIEGWSPTKVSVEFVKKDEAEKN